MKRAALFFSIASLVAASASAQQLYRWKDENGRTHITDTAPSATQGASAAQAAREFPVTLFTRPACQQACAAARSALEKRAVPFDEVQVTSDEAEQSLRNLSGAVEVPTLAVGRSVHRGFDAAAYDALLDSARYPRAGAPAPGQRKK